MPKRTTRIVVLSTKEADALFDLAAALDDFIPEDHPIRRAADKLDEQAAAQYRDPYDEARDELRDQLNDLQEWEYDRLDWDRIARAVVDRLLGVYETTASSTKDRS